LVNERRSEPERTPRRATISRRFAGERCNPRKREPQRKWGRPCGRPHSHRRVVSTEVESLTPGVVRALAARTRRYVARRSRRCRFRRGTDEVRKLRPDHPVVPRPVSRPSPSTGSAMRGIASPSGPAGKSGLPTAHLRGFNGLEVAIVPKDDPGFQPSTARHLAVASKAVPKSLLLSGCYPLHPKSQSPLSMSGECAWRPSRTSGECPSYPLSTLLPVDKGG
jgi:hypothetical protein